MMRPCSSIGHAAHGEQRAGASERWDRIADRMASSDDGELFDDLVHRPLVRLAT